MKTKHLIEQLIKADKHLPFLVNTLFGGACSSKPCHCREKMKCNDLNIVEYLSDKVQHCEKVKNRSLKSLCQNPVIQVSTQIYTQPSILHLTNEEYSQNKVAEEIKQDVIVCSKV